MSQKSKTPSPAKSRTIRKTMSSTQKTMGSIPKRAMSVTTTQSAPAALESASHAPLQSARLKNSPSVLLKNSPPAKGEYPEGGRGYELIPKLRFPEFEGGWAVDELGKLGRFIGGGTPDKSVSKYWFGDIPWISSSDLYEDDIYTISMTRFINEKSISESATKIIPKGSVLFVSRVGTGKLAVNTKDICTSQDFTNLIPENIDSYYLAYFFSANKDALTSLNQGTSIKGFSKSDLEKFRLSFPPPPEQQKIASCLSTLDTLITTETQKLDTLKTHKKGLMQQLFPAEGKTVPELRFPEFEGEWEERKLGDIATIRSGSTPLRSNLEFFKGGNIPWVKTTDLNNSFIFNTEESITPRAKARINPEDSVLVAMYGGFNQIGRTGYLKVPAATNQAISVLNTDSNKIIPIYLLIWLNAKIENWKKIASSSRKDPNITGSDVGGFLITFPCISEQQKIASCLSSLDTLITTQTQKIDMLKTHKKGLMQQLFPVADEVGV